jgi:hypothetical protein
LPVLLDRRMAVVSFTWSSRLKMSISPPWFWWECGNKAGSSALSTPF